MAGASYCPVLDVPARAEGLTRLGQFPVLPEVRVRAVLHALHALAVVHDLLLTERLVPLEARLSLWGGEAEPDVQGTASLLVDQF